MKRWIVMTIMLIAAFAAVLAWANVPAPSFQKGIASAADLGLLLLDADEGIYVLGVQEKSLADRADIQPGDVLLHINGNALRTAEALDSLLSKRSEDMLLIDLQRGKNVFSIKISLKAIVH